MDMDEYLIDRESVVAEVKERNRFYRALIEIKKRSGIALNEDTSATQESHRHLIEILGVCDEALKTGNDKSK